MELKRYIQFVFQWLWLMILFAVISSAIGYAYSVRQTPLYRSSAKALVDVARAGIADVPTFEDMRTRDRLAATYATLLKRRPLLTEVIENLQLKMGAGELGGKISASIVPNTEMIVVSVTDRSPEQAAAIANEVVRVFNRQATDVLSNPYAASISVLNIVEDAEPGYAPVSPNISRTMLLAAAVGVLAAILVGFLINYYDDRVKSSRQIVELTGLSTLVTITHIDGPSAADRLVTANEPRSPTSEIYRMFLAHLPLSTGNDATHIIVVTSGSPGEGKSLTAANLAVALAQTGRRVILIDGDLRLPTLHKFFNLANEKGVTTAIARPEGEAISEHLLTTGVNNLRLMPSGTLPENPTQVLDAPQMTTLIDDLKSEAEIVLFDSPALLAVVDTMLLLRHCDAALLVVQANATRARALNQTHSLLAQSSVQLLGVVLNDAATSQESYLSYYGQSGRHKRYARWKQKVPFLRHLIHPTTRLSATTDRKTQ